MSTERLGLMVTVVSLLVVLAAGLMFMQRDYQNKIESIQAQGCLPFVELS